MSERLQRELTASCVSASCIEVSASVLTQMNTAADPCDDFYEYACGRFARNPLNPLDEAKYSQFSVVTRRNRALVHMVRETGVQR